MTKTVTVRIAVGVTPEGEWEACGCQGWEDDRVLDELRQDYFTEAQQDGRISFTWIEVTLPVPPPREAPPTIRAEVSG